MTIIITAIIFLIVIATISDWRSRKKFSQEYLQFLNDNEGLEIFCYTNRLKFLSVIETTVIPQLDENIYIIKLKGKEPQTDLDPNFVSHILNNIKEVGFPNVMKIVNGSVIDFSLHKPIYDAINNGNYSQISILINEKLNKLRSLV